MLSSSKNAISKGDLNRVCRVFSRGVASRVHEVNANEAHTITMFGANSKIGNPTTFALAPTGSRIIVPYRDDGYYIRPMKMAGRIGQVVPQPYSMFDEDSIRRTMENTDVCINLIGTMKETQHYDLYQANVHTATRIAKIAKEMGVPRMIHVSAAGAGIDAPSEFQRAKYESEMAVKAYFPKASIIRPTQVFGEDDSYLHALMGNMTHKYTKYLPFAEGKTQPIFIRDVAFAIAQIAANPQIDGQTWTLGGTSVFTRLELYEHLAKMISNRPIDFEVMTMEDSMMWAKLFKTVPFIGQLYENVPSYAADYFAADTTLAASAPTKGLAELGIKPTVFDHILLKMAYFHMNEHTRALGDMKLWDWQYLSTHKEPMRQMM